MWEGDSRDLMSRAEVYERAAPTGADAALEAVRQARLRADYRGARDLALAGAAAPRPTGESALVALLIELGRLQDNLGEWRDAERTVERAVAMARALPRGPDAAALQARALTRLGNLRGIQWRHADARAALQEALAVAPPHDAVLLSEILQETGRIEYDLARYAEASSIMQRAVAAAESAPEGPGRDGVSALALAGQGAVHRAEGRFGVAEQLFVRAIELAESVFGPESIEVAYGLIELGMNFKYGGRFDDAEPLYRKAEAIVERFAGTSVHPDIASLYHNLGGLEHARGDYERAKAHARRSVELRRASIGDHPLVALDEGALAAILDALGEDAEAELLLRRTIDTLEDTFGTHNHELAVALNNLAAILARRGDLDAAEAGYRRAVAIKRELLGDDAPEIGGTLNNLAVVLRKRGATDEAETLFVEALSLMRGLEPTHPSIARCARNYARLLRATGRETEAAALEARTETNLRGPTLLDERSTDA